MRQLLRSLVGLRPRKRIRRPEGDVQQPSLLHLLQGGPGLGLRGSARKLLLNLAGGRVRGITLIKAEQPRRSSSGSNGADVLRRFVAAGRAGPYRVHGVLGKGGMGIVLDATSPAGHRVALKMLRPSAEPSRDAMLRARFRREIRLVGRVDHPGVAGRVDDGEIEGVRYLALELVEGVTLSTLRAQGPLDLPMILSLGAQLADALTHIHGCGIVHRDIKPTNVIVTRGGRAVLTDFGVAWSDGSEPITHAGEIVGTPGYVAPELLSGDSEPTPLSDVYALGFMLLEIASIRPRPALRGSLLEQFAAAQRIDFTRFPAEPQWAPFMAVLARMLSPDPSARSPSAAQVRAELLRLRKVLQRARPAGHEPWVELSPFVEDPGSMESVTEPGLQGDPELALITSTFVPETSWARAGFEVPATLAIQPAEPTVAEPGRARTPLPSSPALGSIDLVVTGTGRIQDPASVAPMPASPPKRAGASLLVVAVLSVLTVITAFAFERATRLEDHALVRRGVPLYHSTQAAPPTSTAMIDAKAAFDEAHALNRAGRLPEALAALGRCIELAELPECHGLLAEILEEAASEHAARASRR